MRAPCLHGAHQRYAANLRNSSCMCDTGLGSQELTLQAFGLLWGPWLILDDKSLRTSNSRQCLWCNISFMPLKHASTFLYQGINLVGHQYSRASISSGVDCTGGEQQGSLRKVGVSACALLSNDLQCTRSRQAPSHPHKHTPELSGSVSPLLQLRALPLHCCRYGSCSPARDSAVLA